jgi:endo-1,4-beta-D-glucanase Y
VELWPLRERGNLPDLKDTDLSGLSATSAGSVALDRRFSYLGRRDLFGVVAWLGTSAQTSGEAIIPELEWRSFVSRFVSNDGRIVDNGNGGVSHSEGQGWGLLFAIAARDQVTFDLILAWTVRTLRRPSDTLHAWRFVPNDKPSVKDLNNALDGDLFIAAALARAGRLWGRPDYFQAAAAIGRDILRLLVRKIGPLTVLLPGIEGFENREAIVLNPSYYAFPMINEIAGVAPSERWDRIQNDGKILIEQGRFGVWSLPPDWLRIAKTDGARSPAAGWPPRFSFDAVRVPLWWIWQKLPFGPAMQSVERLWTSWPPDAVPAWVDLQTNSVAPFSATPGMAAVMRLTRIAGGHPVDEVPASVTNVTVYYDAALILLARIAEHEQI